MPDTVTQSHRGHHLTPPLAHATVDDAMHRGILSCQTDAPLTEVARIMVRNRVHCVAVMGLARDDSGEALVWGLITDLDLIRAAVRGDADPVARDLARQPIISVKPDMGLRRAAELMLANRVSHVVVVDPDRLCPIGMLSSLDIARTQAWAEA
jgi:CBS domain-containing protein